MPPDNSPYMYAAYTVTLAVYGLYALSLWRRRRRVQRQLRRLERTDAS